MRKAGRERLAQLGLLLPALVLLIGIFALPMLIMMRMSLNGSQIRPYSAGLTLHSYAQFLSQPLYRDVLWRTVRLATLITVVSVVVGVPFAYLIWRSQGVRKSLLLSVVLLPLFTNVIARLYGWQILMSNDGPINRSLAALHLIDGPVPLNYSFTGATVGLTYVATPYFVLILFSALGGVDWNLVEAARSLGSGRLRSVFEVVLPLSASGFATGVAVAFGWGMGAYAETVTLGSPREWGLGYAAWRQFSFVRNWPFSSVLSILMIATTLAVVVLLMRPLLGRGRASLVDEGAR